MRYNVVYNGYSGVVNAINTASAMAQFQWYMNKWGTQDEHKEELLVEDAKVHGITEVKELD